MRALVLFGLALAACGGEEASLPPITFDMSVEVAAGAEIHECQLVRMPASGGEIFVGGGSYDTSAGTHHFLLFRTAPETPDLGAGPVDCYEGQGLMRYERGFVTGGQLPHDAATFPAGIALPFQPGELLLMQGHFVNTTTAAVTATVHVELDQVAASTIEAKVGTFRFYDPFIYLPPHGAARAQMRCHVHHDVTIVSAGSHMHQRGKSYAAFLDPPGGKEATPFYTTTDWQHPPYYRGPLDVRAGSAIRFQCDYQNDVADPIDQGTSADRNEMCMFSAFYFPAADADEDDCATMDMHGTGDRSCAQTASCLELCPPGEEPHFSDGTADVGMCFQQCITASCPNVTETLFPELSCIQQKCAAACATYGATCTACAVQKCKPELDSCQALACGD